MNHDVKRVVLCGKNLLATKRTSAQFIATAPDGPGVDEQESGAKTHKNTPVI